MTQTTRISKFLKTFAIVSMTMSVLTVQALTISPARDEKTGDPGETIPGSFTLINEQANDLTFYTSVETFDSQGESGTPNFTTAKEGLPTWVKVVDKVILKKGERLTVPYTIEIPKDADSGGHFAAIFLSTVPPSLGNGQVSVGAKVGMLVLLTVTGAKIEQGGLSSFAFKSGAKMLTNLPLDFVYKFKNEGNDRIQPIGDITVKNMFSQESGKVDANKALGNILPKSTRRFEARIGDTDAPAVSAPFFDHVKYQMSNFAFGMYSANINLTFGNKGIAQSSFTYYIIPWQLLSIVLGGLIVAILLLAALLKQYNKWIIKQAQAVSKK